MLIDEKHTFTGLMNSSLQHIAHKHCKAVKFWYPTIAPKLFEEVDISANQPYVSVKPTPILFFRLPINFKQNKQPQS